MEKTGITEDMRTKLREGFPDEAYKPHPTKTFLTTLKAMYITERLNDVFGVGRWHIATEVAERTDDYILVKGIFYCKDYDVSQIEQYGGHNTTGKNTEIADGYKSAVTDCTSKIASYLEIGIDMFKGKINPPKTGVTNNVSNSKYAFGSAKNESLPWIQDGQVTAMIKTIKTDRPLVIKKLSEYKWSKVNKEKITIKLEQ